MKLELKHIAGYLPYGLKVRFTRKSYPPISEIRVLTLEDLDLTIKNSKRFSIKPILRPMSDLYKPLEDGTYPIAVIGRMYEPNGKLYCEDGVYSYGWNTHVCDDYQGYEIGWIDDLSQFGVYYDAYDMSNQDMNFTGDVIPYSFKMLDYIYQHHFDIYNLIGQGLALDINSLNKE